MMRILHVSIDDKFFNSVFKKFKDDPGYEAEAAIFIEDACSIPKYVTAGGEVKLISSKKEFASIMRQKHYDIVFFYPFPALRWPLLRYVPDDALVIWWAWGYDLYSSYFNCPPLIKIDSLMPRTKMLCKPVMSLHERIRTALRNLKNFLPSYYLWTTRNQVLSRIDYFMPVIDVEWEMMRERYSCFRAKLWHFPHILAEESDIFSNKSEGNILVGNSASPYNNHCDIWDVVKQHNKHKGQFIFPLSYGDQRYKKHVVEYIDKDCMVLDSFMSLDAYWKLVDSCSYALFGALRQHAIGNVFHCFEKGIKVFMFKESMAYREFSKRGFHIYAIEDIDDNSFTIPLTHDEAAHNQKNVRNLFNQKNEVYSNFYKTVVNA